MLLYVFHFIFHCFVVSHLQNSVWTKTNYCFSLELDKWLCVLLVILSPSKFIRGRHYPIQEGFWGHQEWKKMLFEYVIVTVFNLMIYFLENYGSCYGLALGMYLFLVVFFLFLHFPGVISCILHSQWRIWFRQATYCQYLHELAEASWVLWWKSYAEQASICHWMCCWIWTKLSWADACLDNLQRNEPVPTL